MNYLEEMKKWKSTPTKDEILRKELKKVNDKNVDKYFGQTITFGTAGIRGVLGAGTNKINEFTIAAAAYAYAATLLKESAIVKKMGLVIAHDNRQNGELFAEITTKVFDHLGIKTYIFKNNEMTATPMLSYSIRKLRAAGGVNITASHNPKEYNGFKVYSAQGSQLMPEITNKIAKLMDKMNFLKVPYGLFKPTFVSKKLTQDYIADVLSIRKRENDGKKLVVVYSALNGTGANIAPYIFQKMDIEYYEVKKEMKNDPLFKGLKSCNPEDDDAYIRSIKLAKKKNADVIILTDPDADRVGLAIKTPGGSYKKINGNQTGAIVLNHLIRTQEIDEEGYIAQSIVSGNVTKEMAKRHKFDVIETHVGFKNIAEAIRDTPEKLIMGYEESYGQLINPEIARDKDAFQGLVLLVEAANYLKTQNKTLIDELNLIGKMYGFHRSSQISKQMTDVETKKLFKEFSKIKQIWNIDVKEILDFTQGEINGLESTPLIKVILENGTWIAMRPSGTEPKVKFYIETIGETQKETDKLTKQMTAFINNSISHLRRTNKQAEKDIDENGRLKETLKKPSDKTKTFEFQELEIKTEKEMLAEQRARYNAEMQGQDVEVKIEKVNDPTPIQVDEVKPVVEKDPAFSLETISPIPAEQTPSQIDPKQAQETKELLNVKEEVLRGQKTQKITLNSAKGQTIKSIKPIGGETVQNEKLKETKDFDFEEDFFKTRITKDSE